MAAKKRTQSVPRRAAGAEVLPSHPCLQILSGPQAGLVVRLRGEIIVGRDIECQLQVEDPSISRRHARLLCEQGQISVEDLDSTNGVYIGEKRVRRQLLNDGDVVSFGSILTKFAFCSQAELDVAGRLFQGATRDYLSGTLARDSFREWLHLELAMARDGDFSLVMIDVDHFRKVRHAHGYSALDGEVLGRWEHGLAGDEFALLLRNVPLAQGLEMAERARIRIHSASPTAKQVRITLSQAALEPTVYWSFVSVGDDSLAQTELAHLNRLSANMAHQLNTPLGAVSLAVELAAIQLKDSPERASKLLLHAMDSIDKMHEVISQLGKPG